MKDIAIIGAGAAGLACAIMIKQKSPDINVTVFEANDRVGKKLSLTGNGRCNITNTNLSSARFHGDPSFAMKIINNFNYEHQKMFFEEIGIPFVTEKDDKVYPMSLQASSVVDMLRFSLIDNGITLLLSTKVTSVNKIGDTFKVKTTNGIYDFSSIIVATGGKSYGKISHPSYDLLKSLGHKIEPLFPSIVQLKTNTEIVKQLKGVKIQGSITLSGKNESRTEHGEILFCDYGLSGPPVLQVSRIASIGNCVAVIDIVPDITKEELNDIITKRINIFKNRPSGELFTGFINKRLGQVILKKSGCNINENSSQITDAQIACIVKLMKKLTFEVLGTTGFENAQVTAGGAQTTQFFDTLMSKKCKGLFAIGEVLDVDGDCGGFNLAFAWASAATAAKAVTEYLK